jgi:hypothetical protein
MLLPSSGLESKSSRSSALKQALSVADVLLGLLFNPDEAGYIFLRNISLTFKGLQDGVSQNTELFKTIAVRAQN